MNVDADQGLSDDMESQRTETLHELGRFAAVMPLSTLGGCCAVALCLWPVVSRPALGAWLVVGVLVALVQFAVRQRFASARNAASSRFAGIAGSALLAGLFWSTVGIVLFPDGSVVHQLLLASALVAVSALWLPLFALAPVTLLVFAAPVLLPMAVSLLASPQAAQATMGSLLLVLFGAFVAVAQAANRMFRAERAARRALHHQATHDSLVGLTNRAEFHRRAAVLDARRLRRYAILVIDLDHFKDVNDTAGHAVGDELLREIGAILRHAIRKGDTAARLGGDEFAILMDDCGEHEAERVAGALVERIHAFRLNRGGASYRVTASIGIAISSNHAATASAVLHAADGACYAAKRGGRNRIEIATLPSLEPLPAFTTASLAGSKLAGSNFARIAQRRLEVSVTNERANQCVIA